MKTGFKWFAGLALLCAAGQASADGWDFESGQWTDLSHAYDLLGL